MSFCKLTKNWLHIKRRVNGMVKVSLTQIRLSPRFSGPRLISFFLIPFFFFFLTKIFGQSHIESLVSCTFQNLKAAGLEFTNGVCQMGILANDLGESTETQ